MRLKQALTKPCKRFSTKITEETVANYVSCQSTEKPNQIQSEMGITTVELNGDQRTSNISMHWVNEAITYPKAVPQNTKWNQSKTAAKRKSKLDREYNQCKPKEIANETGNTE